MKQPDENSSIGDRVAWARAELGLTQGELASRAGVSTSSVGNLEAGLRQKPRQLLDLASALEVSPTWLETGKGKPKGSGPVDLDSHPDLVSVRTVKVTLQAGVTGFSLDGDQSDGPPIFFRADWLRDRGYKPYNLVALKVQGASMEPMLHQGDMVVVNTADTEPKDGKVFAINYEGEALIKRMHRDGGIWWLSSDNVDQRRYPRKECAEGACIVIGRVIHRQSEEL